MGIIVNHYKDPYLNNQDSMESIRPGFFVAAIVQRGNGAIGAAAVFFLDDEIST